MKESGDAFDGTHLMISCLRTLVNLVELGTEWHSAIMTNDLTVPACMRIISSYSLMAIADTEDDDAANKLDIFCMALALVTSLVQSGEAGRKLISRMEVDPACATTRSCLRGCRCHNKINGVQCIVNLYTGQTEESTQGGSAEANFLKGHLAVLLGLLSKDSSSFENIMDLLPGDSRSSKLQSWIDSVTEFTSLYSELTARFAEASHLDMPEEEEDLNDEGNPSPFISPKSNHAAYSTNSLLRIQESQGEEKGIELARNILQILEQFRVSSSTS